MRFSPTSQCSLLLEAELTGSVCALPVSVLSKHCNPASSFTPAKSKTKLMIISYVIHLMSEASDKHNKAVVIHSINRLPLSRAWQHSVLRMKSKSQENKISMHTGHVSVSRCADVGNLRDNSNQVLDGGLNTSLAFGLSISISEDSRKNYLDSKHHTYNKCKLLQLSLERSRRCRSDVKPERKIKLILTQVTTKLKTYLF